MRKWFTIGNTVLAVAGIAAVLALSAQADQNFVRESGYLSWSNSTGANVTNGDVLALGRRYGIAATDIRTNEVGVVRISGVYDMSLIPTNTVAQDEPMYWIAAQGGVQTTQVANSYIGLAVTARAQDTTTAQRVQVDLNAPANKAGAGYNLTTNVVSTLRTNQFVIENGVVTSVTHP